MHFVHVACRPEKQNQQWTDILLNNINYIFFNSIMLFYGL